MAQTIELRVFELLTARLCHDLVGPVGAASNGAELLAELGPQEAGDAVDLIADSAGKASARLRYYRVAYGLAGGGAGAVEAVRELATAMFADQRFALDWGAAQPVALGDGAGKLLLNMLLLAGEAMGREGSLTIAVEAGGEGTRLDILARGEGAKLDPETLTGLSPSASIEALTPRSVQGYFTARLAEFLGSTLVVEPLDHVVRLTCTPPSGG